MLRDEANDESCNQYIHFKTLSHFHFQYPTIKKLKDMHVFISVATHSSLLLRITVEPSIVTKLYPQNALGLT